MITGVEAVSLGGMHMRSNLRLPPRVKCFTESLREAGYFQGRAFLGPQLTPPREYVVSTRDRGNDRYETLRTVTDGRWLYVRDLSRNMLKKLPASGEPETPSS